MIFKTIEQTTGFQHVKKGQLPTKTCPACARPFEWRKKWKDCWEEVVYCSERCRRNKNSKVH